MDATSLFSSVDQQPYGTVTAPQEEGASDTGNDQGPSRQPGTPPMTNLISAIMRGAAKVQGQEQAKKVATKQADSNAKMSITMKPGAPGDPPFVTVKDAPADLLNGTQAADVKEAYNRPARQVEAKIAAQGGQQPHPAAAPTVQAPTTPPPADHPLEQAATLVDSSLGYRLPRPWDPDIAEKLKSEDGIRQIAEEMGDRDPKAAAHQAWRQIQHGKVSAQAVQQRVANFRLQKLESEANRVEATQAPANRAAERAQAEADRQKTEARLQQTQTDAEHKAVLSRKSDIIYKNHDWSTIPKDQRHATFDSENDTGVPVTSYEYAKLDQKAAQDDRNYFEDFFNKKSETYQLGHYPTFAAAKLAFGQDIVAGSPEEARAKNAWQTAHAYTADQAEKRSLLNQATEARLEAARAKLEAAKNGKPTSFDDSMVKVLPASEIIAADPMTTKNYDQALQRKEALLQNEIQTRKDEMKKANMGVAAINAKKYHDNGDPLTLANHNADFQIAMAAVNEKQAQLKQIQAARAARRGQKTGTAMQPVATPATAPAKPPAAPPNVPHRPVANGQYTPEVETGIAKVMADHHIGRQKAIQALRDRGFLQ